MNPTPGVKQGIVLFAHGSRDQRWREPLRKLRQAVEQRLSGVPVEIAYLQFCEPTLPQALRLCHERGAERVLVVPVFLSGGGHTLRDVPEAVAAAAATVPHLSVRASGALGEEPEVMEAMARACLRLVSPDADIG